MLIPKDIKMYLRLEPTDMRKSIDTLCIVVQDLMQLDPGSGHLFIFRNRQGNKLKALYYVKNRFTLIYSRLEKGKFIFPKNAEGQLEMTQEHLEWLLASDKYARYDVMDQSPYHTFC